MSLKLYVDLISQPCRAIMILCIETNLQHQVIETRISKMEQRSEEFVKISPNKQVPAMVDGNFSLTESHAIMRYLVKQYKLDDHWYSNNPQKAALIDRYLDWHHINLRVVCSQLIFFGLFAKNLGLNQPPGFSVESQSKKVHKSLLLFQDQFLDGNNFIGGQTQISIADLSAFCEIIQVSLLNIDLSQYQKIDSWSNKVWAYQSVRSVHVPFMKILKKLNPKTYQKFNQDQAKL